MTLIEILVAVSLLSLLSVAMVMALQIGAGSWQSTRERLMLDRRIATANSILHAEFAGIVPVEADRPPELGGGTRRLAFFQGEPQSMRFVSDYSLTAGVRGGLRIVELQVSDSSRGIRVLLNEIPYLGARSAGSLILEVARDPVSGRRQTIFPPIRPRATSLIIADQLAACRFSYLKPGRNRNEVAVWVPVWEEIDRIPGAIRVELTPLAQEARLLPVSITTQVRARYVPPKSRK